MSDPTYFPFSSPLLGWRLTEGSEQNDEELRWLCDKLAKLDCKSILEIGSRNGRTLQAFANACPSAVLFSIDIARPPGWFTVAQELMNAGRELYEYNGSSHDATTLAFARHNAPFDFIFIDGDHSTAGVAADWYNYSPLGHLVGLHDIDGASEGVRRLWQDLSILYAASKKTAVPNSMGIGLINPSERYTPFCPRCGRNGFYLGNGFEIRCESCK